MFYKIKNLWYVTNTRCEIWPLTAVSVTGNVPPAPIYDNLACCYLCTSLLVCFSLWTPCSLNFLSQNAFFLSLRGTSMKSRADAAPITSHACCSLTDPFVSHGEVLLWQDKAWPDLTKWNCFTAFIFSPSFECHSDFLCQYDYNMQMILVDPEILIPNPKNTQFLTPPIFLEEFVCICVCICECVFVPQ